jgi:hypothetical protein
LDVAGAAPVQGLHRVDRGAGLLLLDRQLGAGHQLRGAQPGRLVGALEPLLAAAELAHAVRSARGHQRREPAGRGRGLRRLREPLGAAEASLEEREQRVVQRGGGTLRRAALAVLAPPATAAAARRTRPAVPGAAARTAPASTSSARLTDRSTR